MNRQQYCKPLHTKVVAVLWIAACCLLPALTQAGPNDPIQIVQAPMMTTQTVDPNVYWALDDSGSMNFEHTTRRYYRSCAYNNDGDPGSCSNTLQTDADQYTYGNTSSDAAQTTGNNLPGTSGAVLRVGSNLTSAANLRDAIGYERNIYRYDWRSRSSDFNVTYFNPEIDYQPWPEPDANDPPGTTYANANFRQARPNGNNGTAMNLTCYNGHWTGTASTGNCTTSGSPGGRSPATFEIRHYDMGSGYVGRNGRLDGFVFEKWIDTHRLNNAGQQPVRNADQNAVNGRMVGRNGQVDWWDEHVRYHVRYCSSASGPAAGRWTASGVSTTMSANTFPNNTTASTAVWCPQVGYVVEWFYITYDRTASARYEPRVRARGAFANGELDNAVDPDGNAVGTGLSANQLAQRSANWYQYYRTRLQLLKSAVGAAVRANSKMRYGMRFMNSNTGVTTTVPAADISDYTTHNRSMLQGLYGKTATGGTPLTAVVENSASYLRNTAPMPYSCQHNFIIAFTDGYANTNDDASGTVGNFDGDNWNNSLADVARYYYMNDIRGGLANNVASSRHPNRDGDNKTHQHISIFPVALGLRGYLEDANNDGLPDRDWNGNPFTPTVSGNWVSAAPSAQADPRRLDIMWKAAFNSDGKYIAAADARALVNGINNTLKYILERTASSSAAAASAGQLTAGLLAFQPNYDSGKWTGKVRAFRFDAATREFNEVMEYGARLDAQPLNSRQIVTINSQTRNGVRFERSAVSTEQIGRLIGPGGDTFNDVDAPYPITTGNAAQIAENNAYADDLINWLRGNDSVVSTSPSGMSRDFRGRTTRLGDIVNSSPAYVGGNFRYYPRSIEAESYNVFQQANKNRPPMLYVGANDGMLHGFKVGDVNAAGDIVFGSDAGREKIAYVPNAVYRKLAELSNPDYTHYFYVDAPITVVEAYSNNFAGAGKWRSVLVAGMGGGGQGVFALDVTNPANFTETNANNVVLWEFGDRASSAGDDGDPDIGNVFGVVEITKLPSGHWVAIFGNGYGATDATDGSAGQNRAKLFIVDIATGKLIRKIDTAAEGTGSANGLSQPVAVDSDGNFVTDMVYAGDMEGDIWKFDLRSTNPASWSVTKVFDGTPNQPIFGKPTVMQHPKGGMMVFFGTGRYLNAADNVNAGYPVQAFYGIWDKPGAGPVVGTGGLQQQTVITETRTTVALGNVQVRISSNNEVDYSTQRGWYLTLPDAGERIVANPDMIMGFGGIADSPLVRFHTYIPSQDPCSPSGDSWTMMLDALSGARPKSSVYDFNGDGRFDDLDMDYANDGLDGMGASGYKNSNGMIGLSGDKILDDSSGGTGKSSICAGLASGTDTGETVDISTTMMCNQRQGRGAWRQLVDF